MFTPKSLFLLLLVYVTPLWALEHIASFESVIAIETDGKIHVTETITLQAEGHAIQHGIYRDIPVYYTLASGKTLHTPLTIDAVTLDGQITPYRKTTNDSFERLYIGDPTGWLPLGIHTYTLSYTTDFQIMGFEKFDELYWNVTGNAWTFPILFSRATIYLPTTTLLQKAAYTGPLGSRGQDYRFVDADEKTVVIETTRALKPFEGFTVAVAWPKEIVKSVTEPHSLEAAPNLFVSYLGFISILCTLLSCLFYALKPYPKKGTIIPLYTPPKALSPAAINFIYDKGRDLRTAFTAAFIHLATEGYIKLEKEDNTFSAFPKQKENTPLHREEKELRDQLFQESSAFIFDKRNEKQTRDLFSNFENTLRKEYTNLSGVSKNNRSLLGVFLSFCSIMPLAVCAKGIFPDNVPLLLITVLVPFILCAFFAALPDKRTPSGQKILEEIKGFRLFLKVTDRNQYTDAKAPQYTFELFERYLPFAIALGVEKSWHKQFEDLFKESDFLKRHTFYTSSSIQDLTKFQNHLSSSLNNSRSSFSGSGGHGSSGGGRGGGGGGGW